MLGIKERRMRQGGGEDEDENDITYLSKLFHKDGVPEQLQAHHFRILWYCSRYGQGIYICEEFVPQRRIKDAPARSGDMDLSPELQDRLVTHTTLAHRRLRVGQLALLKANVLFADGDSGLSKLAHDNRRTGSRTRRLPRPPGEPSRSPAPCLGRSQWRTTAQGRSKMSTP